MIGTEDQTRPAAGAYWVRPGLDVEDDVLHIAGMNTLSIAASARLPVFVTDLAWIGVQARKLHSALAGAGLEPCVRLAIKAQREPEILRYIRGIGSDDPAARVGIDACSPNEVDYAIKHGWAPEEISCTGTNMTDDDLQRVIDSGTHLNLDLLSQLDRYGRLAPGTRAGIRINPRAGAAWGGRKSLYAGTGPTKFGIYEEQIADAVAIARRHSIELDTVHIHVGDGFLTDDLGEIERAVAVAARVTERLKSEGFPIGEVNTGGGVGLRLREEDAEFDLAAWANMLGRHLGPLNVRVGTEPGNFLTKQSTIVLAEVVTVEDRLGHRFVGLNVGWNVVSFKFLYDVPFTYVPCRNPLAEPVGRATLSGNINEGNDLFAENIPFPAVEEGDYIAILNAGGYNQAMQSDHCLRPRAATICF
jgi:diaminopimelate decarboxylase